MLGAIAGDVIGSVFEGRKRWLRERHPGFEPLFHPEARFTDDTVLSVAVADWILRGGDLTTLLRAYHNRYPAAGFGRDFRAWALSDSSEPYGSWGNGSAMRVGPVAWAAGSLSEVLQLAEESARVTHDHPEGIRGARATAMAIYLARSGATKAEIEREVEKRFEYDLATSIAALRPGFGFDSSCRGTVPPALVAFLESTDFESAVRLAVSLGGDSDTLASIAGAVAGAYYGVPDTIRTETLSRLDEDLLNVLAEFEERFPETRGDSIKQEK